MQLQYGDIDLSVGTQPLEECKNIIQWDFYNWSRDYNSQTFDDIIDIGANSGTASLYARILFPFANIHSFEPNPLGYANIVRLKDMFRKMHGRREAGTWHVYHLGLGDGQPVFLLKEQEGNDRENIWHTFTRRKPALGAIFQPVSAQPDYDGRTVDTVTLKELIDITNIDLDKNLSMKLDCEGAESYLYSEENLEILKKFKHIAGEVHFRDELKEACDFVVDLETHKKRLAMLEDTFDIKYFKGGQKVQIVHILLTRKEDNITGLKGLHF